MSVRSALTMTLNNLKSRVPLVYLSGVLFPHIYTNVENNIPYNVVPMSLTSRMKLRLLNLLKGFEKMHVLSRFGMMKVLNQFQPIMQAYHLPSPYDLNFFGYLWSEFINQTVGKKDLRTLDYKHVQIDGEYNAPVCG